MEAALKPLEWVGEPRSVIVGNKQHRVRRDDGLAEPPFRDGVVLLQPEPRNTAHAIALAPLGIVEVDACARMLALLCDHWIADYAGRSRPYFPPVAT